MAAAVDRRRRGPSRSRGRGRRPSAAWRTTSTAARPSPDRTTAGSPACRGRCSTRPARGCRSTIGAIVWKYCCWKLASSLCQRSLPVLRLERDQVVVGRDEEQVVAPHADAAVADVRAALRLPEVVPDLAAVVGVERPDVVGRRDVEHAVDLQNRPLDLRRAAATSVAFAADDHRRSRPAAAARRAGPVHQAPRPRQRQLLHVPLVDLRQRAEAPARVVAASRWATSRRAAAQQRRSIHGLRRQASRRVSTAAHGQRASPSSCGSSATRGTR